MAEEAVLKYLTNANRPYSTNDIVQNLHKQWGKTAVQKALDALVQKSLILEKAYGKQKVYVVRQTDEDDDSIKRAIKELDEQIMRCQEDLKETDDELKNAESKLKGLQSSLTSSQIKDEITKVVGEVHRLSEKLTKVSSNSVPIPPEELKKVKGEGLMAAKEYRIRKRLCMQIVNAVLEGYPKSKKDLFQDIGLETDEEADFVLDEDLLK